MNDDELDLLFWQSPPLRRLPYVACRALGSAVMRTARFDVHQAEKDMLIGSMAASVLAAQVVADKRTFQVEHPASWWQHLKLSLPGWWQRRWPARMTETVIEVDFRSYDTFPRASSQLDVGDFGYPVRQDLAGITLVAPRWRVLDSGHATVDYADRFDVARAIDQIAAKETGANSYSPWLRTITLLNALGELGVNPDQLVREDTITRRL